MHAVSSVTSEVGRLRTVLLHRPGDELKRLTPRNNVELLFDGVAAAPTLPRCCPAAALVSRGVGIDEDAAILISSG